MGRRSDNAAAHDEAVGRRALLRRGGALAAATVTGVAVAGLGTVDAQATSGDPVIQGQANDAGAARTSLASTAATSTLALANTGNHAPLVLAQQTWGSFVATSGGELENLDGDLYYTVDFGGGNNFPTIVNTEFTANQVITVVPQRIVDTRTSAGRAKIVNRTGNLDSAGRLLGAHTITIDLSDLEIAAASAFCNLTVVTPLGNGFMTLFPGGTRPSTSSISYTKGVTIANFAVTGTSVNDTISIYTSATSHLLLDLTALNVGSANQISPTILPAAKPAAAGHRLATRARAGTLPKWYRGSR